MKLTLGLCNFPLLLFEELKKDLAPYECKVLIQGLDVEVVFTGDFQSCNEVIEIVQSYNLKPPVESAD